MCTHPIASVADAVQQSCIRSRAQFTAGGWVAGNPPHANSAQNALYIISIAEGTLFRSDPATVSPRSPIPLPTGHRAS